MRAYKNAYKEGMKKHKKILPGFFEDLVEGTKTYEFRLNDEDLKDIQPGDTLVLEEWSGLGEDRKPTGRTIKKTVTHALRLAMKDLLKYWSREDIEEKGFLIMSLKD